jgi:hypothetical protein
MDDGKPLRGMRKAEVVRLETLEELKELLQRSVPPDQPAVK